MTNISLKAWSERQQVLAIIMMAGLALTALWFFLLLPQNRKRKDLEHEIESMRAQLASKNLLLGEDALQTRRNEEATYNRKMHAEWTNTVGRMTAFPQHQDLLKEDIGHIDYKVALFDVRQRLLKKSREMKIRLRHYDFGMEEAVRSDEDARILMLQLRSVEKLVDFALDLKIDMLRDIDPLPPISHQLGDEEEPYIEEYPVEIGFYGGLETMLKLLNASLETHNAFVLRRVRMESEIGRPDLLRVTAVMSALVFLKDPDDLVEDIPTKPVERLTPIGH